MRPHLIRGAADGCDQKLIRRQHQLRGQPLLCSLRSRLHEALPPFSFGIQCLFRSQ
jgi:hypothetical protein